MTRLQEDGHSLSDMMGTFQILKVLLKVLSQNLNFDPKFLFLSKNNHFNRYINFRQEVRITYILAMYYGPKFKVHVKGQSTKVKRQGPNCKGQKAV